MKVFNGLVYASAEEMRKFDELATIDYGMDIISLMENAGVAVAQVAKQLLGGRSEESRVGVLAGKGNNGGDGLVAARHLTNWGFHVEIVLAEPRLSLGPTPSKQLAPVERMGLTIREGKSSLGAYDLVVDALLGYGAKGNPREPVASLIREANSSGVPILAVDLPSGLDPDTGTPCDPCIRARTTVTLALPKMGFLEPRSKPYVGELYLADVSIPRPAYERLFGLRPPFAKGALYKVQ